MSKSKLRVVFMGTPAFAVPVLQALAASDGVQVAAVYTRPDRPKGRGLAVEMPAVKSCALDLGLQVFQPASLRNEAAQEQLAGLEPEVIVVAAYGQLLPSAVLNAPSLGCLNLHPSLLPKYRGASPVATAILDGEAATGVTVMLLDEGMDTGPIVAQLEYPLSGDETAGDLTTALFKSGAELLLSQLGPWAAGEITAKAQDGALATVTRRLERGDGEADWKTPALELGRRCRAFNPWPGLYTQWGGKTLKLLEVEPVPGDAAPGAVVGLGAGETPVGVGTVDGILGLKSLQLEGRRAVSAAEFLSGYRQFVGAQL